MNTCRYLHLFLKGRCFEIFEVSAATEQQSLQPAATDYLAYVRKQFHGTNIFQHRLASSNVFKYEDAKN